ncbi:MAG: gliding motility-associated C-terminal domain-containing protein [Flavobacteriales bacterium]|nr:gliding motility-associated C-terminal domain-containing protein [Flavobacteriales bacterium]
MQRFKYTGRHKYMRLKLFLIALFISVCYSQSVRADHIMGTDITYRCSNTNDSIFDIILNFYRDCRGCYVLGQNPKCGTSEDCNSSGTVPTSLTLSCMTGSTVGTITMKRTTIEDITRTCKKEISKCAQPCNGTYPFGIEKHTFVGTIDLRSAMKNGCCRFKISTTINARSVYITTGPRGGFSTYMEMDACKKPCNTSPQLTNDPVAILCCNQPYFFNNGAVDTVNYDSLSYSLVSAYSNANTKSSYNGGFSGDNPMTVYYPPGKSFPFNNPNTDPPIGIFLDPETGDLIFTPTDCAEQSVVVMQIDEWRKNKNGVYENVGITRRDMQFIVQNCPGNNPPKITNKTFKYTTCAGTKLCFDITTEDKVFVPPPPAKTPAPDTVNLTWNRGIPGATFIIKNSKAREKVAEFCWTPKKNQASDLPYTFTATAIDDNCPKNAVTTRSFSVLVLPVAEADRFYDTLPCGKYAIRSKIFANFKEPAVYEWEVSDSNNLPLTGSHYYFTTNRGLRSKLAIDTIQFRQGGKYIIHHKINNRVNCPTDYFDTIIVPKLLEIDLALGPDTFVCAGSTLRLQPKVRNGAPAFKYKWLTPSFHPQDTMNYFDVIMSTKDSTVRVEITDRSKCVAFDTINIFLKPNPKVDMGPDVRICWYDSFTITPNARLAYWIDPVLGDTLPQGDTLLWSWEYFGIPFSSDTSVRVAQKGFYTVTVVDSLGCNWTDTLELLVNDTLFPGAGPDQIKCFNDTLFLVASGLDTIKNGKKGTYRWYRGLPKAPPVISTKEKFNFKIPLSNPYLLELEVQEDTLKCFGFDTTFITVNPLPILTLTNPLKYCCDYGNIGLGSSIFGSPTGGVWSCRQNPGLVSSNNFLTPSLNCDPSKVGVFTMIYTYQEPVTKCFNKDSTRFTINSLPALKLEGGTICQNANRVKMKPAAPAKIYIPAPINLNAMTNIQWRLLKSIPKTGGGNCTVNDLINDDDPSLNYDFWLNVSKSVIDLGSKSIDSFQLEIAVQDGEGCFNRDTAWFYIVKVPTLTFNAFPDLCIDKGVVDLIKLTNTQPTSGKWSVVDSAGVTKPKANLQIGLDTNNGDTLDTKKLNLISGPGLYKMRYSDVSTGCYIKKDTLLRINPLPSVNISINPNPNQNKYCEVDPDVTLIANPTGGTWTSSVPGTVSGDKFKPGSVPAGERDKWITLTYKYTHPTTKCDTMKSLQVFVQSKPIIDILRGNVDTCMSNSMDIPLAASYSFTNKISWVHSANPATASFTGNIQLSNDNPTTYTIKPRADSTTTVVITAFTDATGVCPFDQKNITLIIHPNPDVDLNLDDDAGCVPHEVNLTANVTNGVDPTKATYEWNTGSGYVQGTSPFTHTFNSVGNQSISLKVTSDFGCSTLFGPLNVSVYPIPVADFTPNPNNSTTAALPRFSFANNSYVANDLGSKILSNFWDFGDLLIDTDTSTMHSPSYYYSSDTANYWVRLIVVSNYGCADTSYKQVIVGPDILVFIPNAFSPNGSGPLLNDKFTVFASGYNSYSIMIFNRWGEILYKSDDLSQPWDGNYNGEPCQMDAYVYRIEVTSFNDKLYKYSGTINLIR